MTLMLHCGGIPVTLEELGGFELPTQTQTYMPVSHADFVRLAEDRVRRELGYGGPIDWQHSVNREGRQYFGVAKMPEIKLTDLQCLQMGLRSSYDRSMANGVAFGPMMFVCDNLAFVGSLVTLFRKHTKNIWNDMRKMLVEALDDVIEKAGDAARGIESWREVDIDQDRGYELIGLMRGRGLLTPVITNNAFREWQRPRQELFQPRTAFSLYNATTEALKVVAPGRALSTYTGVHDFFRGEVVDFDKDDDYFVESI